MRFGGSVVKCSSSHIKSLVHFWLIIVIVIIQLDLPLLGFRNAMLLALASPSIYLSLILLYGLITHHKATFIIAVFQIILLLSHAGDCYLFLWILDLRSLINFKQLPFIEQLGTKLILLHLGSPLTLLIKCTQPKYLLWESRSGKFSCIIHNLSYTCIFGQSEVRTY